MSASVGGVPRRLSTDEFLQWLEGRPETERWELIDGEPVRSMAPETVRHVELKRNVLEALRAGIRKRGLPCRALGDGVAVRVDERSFFQPDASVTCAERVDPDAIEIPEPMIVVEVVSPGTRVRDQTVKLIDYFAVLSVQHYLLIETRRRLVLHHRRGAEDEIVTRFDARRSAPPRPARHRPGHRSDLRRDRRRVTGLRPEHGAASALPKGEALASGAGSEYIRALCARSSAG